MANVIGNGKIVTTYSIADLLLTWSFKGNELKLSKFLKISRGTLRKYSSDRNQVNNMIVRDSGKYVFMSVPHYKELS